MSLVLRLDGSGLFCVCADLVVECITTSKRRGFYVVFEGVYFRRVTWQM